MQSYLTLFQQHNPNAKCVTAWAFEIVDIWDRDIGPIGCFGVGQVQLIQVLQNGFHYYEIASMKKPLCQAND
jgi:hypothetical protein